MTKPTTQFQSVIIESIIEKLSDETFNNPEHHGIYFLRVSFWIKYKKDVTVFYILRQFSQLNTDILLEVDSLKIDRSFNNFEDPNAHYQITAETTKRISVKQYEQMRKEIFFELLKENDWEKVEINVAYNEFVIPKLLIFRIDNEGEKFEFSKIKS